MLQISNFVQINTSQLITVPSYLVLYDMGKGVIHSLTGKL